MKGLNNAQIEQVKELRPWSKSIFHGNRKTFGFLPVDTISNIISKKYNRERLKYQTFKKTDLQKVRDLISWSMECKGSSYFKIMIEGTTGIYYASSVYLHSDYNKSRLFDKSEKTLKLMRIFNAIVND